MPGGDIPDTSPGCVFAEESKAKQLSRLAKLRKAGGDAIEKARQSVYCCLGKKQ